MKVIRHQHKCVNAQSIGMRDKKEVVFKDFPNLIDRHTEPIAVYTPGGDVIRMFKTSNELFAWHVIERQQALCQAKTSLNQRTQQAISGIRKCCLNAAPFPAKGTAYLMEEI